MEPFDYKVVEILQEKYKSEKPIVKKIPKDCDVLYNGEHGLLVVPRTVKAIASLTKKTIWCISYPIDNPDHSFYTYSSNAYVFISASKDIYGWHVDLKTGYGKFITQYSNKLHGIGKQQIIDLPPIRELFDLIENEILKSAKLSYYYSLTMIQGRWQKCEGVIFEDDIFSKKYLHLLRKHGEELPEYKVHTDDKFFWGFIRKQWNVIKSWF